MYLWIPFFVCLSIVREKSDDEVVQRAMVSHWKGTQKHVMSVVSLLKTYTVHVSQSFLLYPSHSS